MKSPQCSSTYTLCKNLPLQCNSTFKVASKADFMQCDITYDDCKDYPYIFNAVAFDNISMEWIVVARLRLDCQSSAGYALCFKKIFDKCRSSCEYEWRCRSVGAAFCPHWSGVVGPTTTQPDFTTCTTQGKFSTTS